MIKRLLNYKKHLALAVLAIGSYNSLQAQCLGLTCSPNITVTAATGTCGAVVNYSTPAVTGTCMAASSSTFAFTGAPQSFTVPAGVNSITIETWGAQGGANWVNNTNFGGYAKGTFTVTPGEVLAIYVGGQPTTGIVGGYNGGGTGEGAGKGGGGGTDVRRGGTTYNDRIIVAGGGGGAGYWSSLHVVGGQGGGLVGTDGYRDPSYASNPGGQGATQTASGYGTCVSFSVTAMAGGFGFGGSPSGCGCEGYGGGGGWYGGAGSGNCRGGGGGSGYLLPTATNTMFATGTRTGNGQVVLTYGVPPTATLTAGLPSGSGFPVGTTVQTYSVADSFSNTATCSFSVTVIDAQTPTVTCPGNVTQCISVPVSSIAPVSSFDNCSSPTITYSLSGVTTGTGTTNASGASFNVGVTNVTYIATDASGNVGTCTFSVTISACTGVEAIAPLSGVKIYPNPNNGEFVVNLGTYNSNMTLEVYNVLGEKVVSEKITSETTQVKLNNKANGTYIVKIMQDNQMIYKSSIIKQ